VQATLTNRLLQTVLREMELLKLKPGQTPGLTYCPVTRFQLCDPDCEYDSEPHNPSVPSYKFSWRSPEFPLSIGPIGLPLNRMQTTGFEG